jgi:hypothetical protein
MLLLLTNPISSKRSYTIAALRRMRWRKQRGFAPYDVYRMHQALQASSSGYCGRIGRRYYGLCRRLAHEELDADTGSQISAVTRNGNPARATGSGE